MLTLFALAFGRNFLLDDSYFPWMVKSISCLKDTSLLIIGDSEWPHGIKDHPILSSKITFSFVKWEDLKNKTEYFLNGEIFSDDKISDYSKASDFKPLIPALFPNLFSSSEFIGWIDIDLIIGSDFDRMISHSDFNSSSYIQFIDTHYQGSKGLKLSFSPISIINKNAYNEIILPVLKRERMPLYAVFKYGKVRNYSGWGAPSWGGLGYKHSFSYIISLASSNPLFTMTHINSLSPYHYLSDHICNPTSPSKIIPNKCGLCESVIISYKADSSVSLRSHKKNPVLFCHLQSSKKANSMINPFGNPESLQTFLEAKKVTVSSTYSYGLVVHTNL